MKDIDEILIGYFEAYLQLKEMMKGDWSKLDILVNNNERAKELCETMSTCMNDFQETISLGNVFICSPEFEKLFQSLEKISEKDANTSINFDLERIMDMIADSFSNGVEDGRYKALYSLSQLPKYSPDDWIRRKYMIHGIQLSPGAKEIPQSIIIRFEEVCYSFIYGNFLATTALARATVEIAIQDIYSVSKDKKFYKFMNEDWYKIKGLREYENIRKKVEFIRESGNRIMHNPKDKKVIQFNNERTAEAVLTNLKSVIEFLYN